MLSISNKFDVGQEVYYIGRKCYQNGKKKKFVWNVKSKEPVNVSIISINYLESQNYLIILKDMGK